jgi:hypothetical protein
MSEALRGPRAIQRPTDLNRREPVPATACQTIGASTLQRALNYGNEWASRSRGWLRLPGTPTGRNLLLTPMHDHRGAPVSRCRQLGVYPVHGAEHVSPAVRCGRGTVLGTFSAVLAAQRAIRGDQALPPVSIAGLWIMTGLLGLSYGRVDLVDLRLGAMSG